ncbi:MAG: type II toxin-antitoxin system VapC family toxin [Planctomycetes bacterium]|nr:type II toxin-antitoxin system VapC family toxin [Planctomycetota bacterium]
MGVVVDTSVWVDVERGRLALSDLEAALGADTVFATPVTIAELAYGVRRARTQEQRATRSAALKICGLPASPSSTVTAC